MGLILGPLSVACVYQADLQLFNRHVKGLTLSPIQVYDNSCEDLQMRQYFHWSYGHYMNQTICRIVQRLILRVIQVNHRGRVITPCRARYLLQIWK